MTPAHATHLLKRRGWDSNPRDTFGAHALSRRADSTALAPLHMGRPWDDGEGEIQTPSATRAQSISNQPPSPLALISLPSLASLRPWVSPWSYVGHQLRTPLILPDVSENVETPIENTPSSTTPKREEQRVFPGTRLALRTPAKIWSRCIASVCSMSRLTVAG
jgi:hypothetical protein